MMSGRVLLYTEMYTVEQVLEAAGRGEAELRELLAFDPAQRPLAVQLGGRDPASMGQAAAVCARFGYDEININVGCPSGKVYDGGFGACLMAEPQLVQQLAAAVRAVVPPSVSVTVKHRLGVDDYDSWKDLCSFVRAVAAQPASVQHFIVHCRCAVLGKGLTTAWNRSVPPLRHEWAWALSLVFPELSFELNGGVISLEHARLLLQPRPISCLPLPSSTPSCEIQEPRLQEPKHVEVRGVMIGRAAFYSPWQMLADADRRIFGEQPSLLTRRKLLAQYVNYAEEHWKTNRASLEASVVAEMATKGVRVKRRSKGRLPLPRAAGELLKAKLHELRQALYQPLLHLFDEIDETVDADRAAASVECSTNGVCETSGRSVNGGASLRAPERKSPWEMQLRKARDSQCSVREAVAKALAVVRSGEADMDPVGKYVA